eukprot:365410-Chlamydomonas_euryale.AAC.5
MLERVAQHYPFPPRRAFNCDIRPTRWGFLMQGSEVYISPPARPAFPRHVSPPLLQSLAKGSISCSHAA